MDLRRATTKRVERLKEGVTSTLVLQCYNLQEEVTTQRDASQSGLNVDLLRNGQPLAYASRALNLNEMSYAQVEMELLAIVFACETFDAFDARTYSFVMLSKLSQVYNKNLRSIFHKEIHAAPKRLQRMLRLQK